MAKQTDIEDKTQEVKAGGGKRGRPKGPKTCVTSVVVRRDVVTKKDGTPLKNGEIVERIEAWLDAVNLQKLIKNAISATMHHFQNTGEYRPVSFKSTDVIYDEVQKSIRMKTAMRQRLEEVADLLGTTKTEIIRIALGSRGGRGGDFMDDGAYLARSDGKVTWEPATTKTRRNSSESKRETMDFWGRRAINEDGKLSEEEVQGAYEMFRKYKID